MFSQQYRNAQLKDNKTKISPQELTALAAAEWRVMSESDREPYVKASVAERATYDASYKAWKLANPDVPTGYNKDGARRPVDLPNRSAYTIFLDSVREWEGEGMDEKTLVQQAAACWHRFSEAERRPFQSEAKRERAEFKTANPKPSKSKKAKLAAASAAKTVPLAKQTVKSEPVAPAPVLRKTDKADVVAAACDEAFALLFGDDSGDNPFELAGGATASDPFFL